MIHTNGQVQGELGQTIPSQLGNQVTCGWRGFLPSYCVLRSAPFAYFAVHRRTPDIHPGPRTQSDLSLLFLRSLSSPRTPPTWPRRLIGSAPFYRRCGRVTKCHQCLPSRLVSFQLKLAEWHFEKQNSTICRPHCVEAQYVADRFLLARLLGHICGTKVKQTFSCGSQYPKCWPETLFESCRGADAFFSAFLDGSWWESITLTEQRAGDSCCFRMISL